MGRIKENWDDDSDSEPDPEQTAQDAENLATAMRHRKTTAPQTASTDPDKSDTSKTGSQGTQTVIDATTETATQGSDSAPSKTAIKGKRQTKAKSMDVNAFLKSEGVGEPSQTARPGDMPLPDAPPPDSSVGDARHALCDVRESAERNWAKKEHVFFGASTRGRHITEKGSQSKRH